MSRETYLFSVAVIGNERTRRSILLTLREILRAGIESIGQTSTPLLADLETIRLGHMEPAHPGLEYVEYELVPHGFPAAGVIIREIPEKK